MSGDQQGRQKTERRIEKAIEVDAPVAEVWKALTDPGGLVRRFPLEARVTPGPGGTLFISWGLDCEGTAEIVAWEPNRRFAWKESMAVVEWTLEARGGKTLLRMVQSGFLGNEDLGERMVRVDRLRLGLHAARLALVS
jgi:uncharacterized protein YndB with AHSA1/START domain